MKKNFFIVIFLSVLLCSNNGLFSQSKEWVEYLALRDTADNLYNLEKYEEAKLFFDKMWSIKNKFYYKYDLYWYVCCMAFTRDTLNIEPYLLELVQTNGFIYKYISELHEYLYSLHYWNKIDSIAKMNDNDRNYSMIDSLEIMANREQDARKGLSQYPLHYVDSINLVKLKELITLYGFPTWKLVGWDGAKNAWLITQHAPHEFRKWYFTLYVQAVEEENASIIHYAYLIDRINIFENTDQLYGTQMISNKTKSTDYYFPIEDIEHLNDRRETVLLPPLDLSKITIENNIKIKK